MVTHSAGCIHSHGTHAGSDPTIREFVLHLNEQASKKFVLRILDTTHLFIDASYVETLQAEFNALVDENTYTFIEGDG